MTGKTPIQAAEIFGQHIIQQWKRLRASAGAKAAEGAPPLFVGMQGPQGCGKTTVARLLVELLRTAGYSVAVLSMDDLYHPHSVLQRIARESPHNPLLAGRGQPGTHDIELGTRLLDQLHHINAPANTHAVQLPVFDKSLHNGEGDRAHPSAGPRIPPPLDIFVLEGWSMGFANIAPDTVREKQRASAPESPLRQYALRNLLQINENLRAYEKWYNYFDVFLQIRPTDLHHVYTWRLEQEHAMKAANGGAGMSDDAVNA
jgi:D-glycerate 3-kinase